MKRSLGIILFLVSGLLYADGFYSAGSFSVHERNSMFEDIAVFGANFRTNVLVGAEYYGVFAEAEQTTSMIMCDFVEFRPYREEYYIRAGYRYKKVFVQYEHLCIHGVDMINPGGGYNRLSIGFDTRQNEKD